METTTSIYSRKEILKNFFNGAFLTAEIIQRTIASMLAKDELDAVKQTHFDPTASDIKKELFKRFSAGSFPTSTDYRFWIDNMMNLRDDSPPNESALKTKEELKAIFAPESLTTSNDYHLFINSMVNWYDDSAFIG